MSKLSEKMVRDGHLGGYVAGGDPATWCPALWAWAIGRFSAGSVLDVGCGEAHSTRYFLDAGCDAVGVEGCPQAVANTAAPGRVVPHDFTAGPYLPDRPFDLVWSCEFLEHIDERYVPHILATFRHAARALLVTHAFPWQTSGHHHVNCRPSRYWIRLIEALGFTCDPALSRQARSVALADYPGVNHFARSGLVFVRTGRQVRQAPAWLKDLCINWGFRLSAAYRRRKRERRRQRRGESTHV